MFLLLRFEREIKIIVVENIAIFLGTRRYEVSRTELYIMSRNIVIVITSHMPNKNYI